MAKIKVIAFGIGTSCKLYLEKYRDEYEIVALSDWDPATHNTFRYGYKIINPYEFNDYEHDKILILSFYVNEIIGQLSDRLQVGTEDIIVPQKHKIKGVILPFEDPATKEFGRELIVYFSNLAKKNDIHLFLDYGSLLGLTRDGDIIDWDDDIDFTINQNQAEQFLNLIIDNKSTLPEADKILWGLRIKRNDQDEVYQIVLKSSTLVKELYRPISVSIAFRKIINNMSVNLSFKYLASDRKFFDNNALLNIWGEDIIVPFNHIEYLNFVYGDWHTPKKHTFGTIYGTLDAEFSEINFKKMNTNFTEEWLF